MNVLKKSPVSLESFLPELIDLRRHFHAHPELSGEEHQTAALVAGELRKYGWTVTESIGRTGLIAELGNISNPLVGVWNMTSVSFTNDGTTTTIDASNDFSIVFIFNEDGTFSNQGVVEGESHSESGTWSTSGNKLTVITEDVEEGTVTDIWDYTLSGSSFSVTFTETEDGGTYTLSLIHI